MRRRDFLATAAAAVAAPAIAPAVARAQTVKPLIFIPQADLAVLDPITNVSYVTRNHALMVFDTLYGVDEQNVPRPQMVSGHTIENDGTEWRLTLREGLRFHDGAPVLARDVVASLRRWGARDNAGQVLMATTDELSAPDDKTVRFRLKRPFPYLPDALGKLSTNIAVIMPERLANTAPTTALTEMVGSGPFRFEAAERVAGERAVYSRFSDYVPRADGVPSCLAGPKVAHIDRVEWRTISDVATAASALQTAEVDWWESPTADYWSLLERHKDIKLEVIDPYGLAGVLRFNCLLSPTDNVMLRRAALAAISQDDVMMAVIGEDRRDWADHVGFFLPGTPMASNVGLAALKEPPDRDAARKLLATSGYDGQKLTILIPADFATIKAQGGVVADALQKIGINLDIQMMDWGTLLSRANNKGPVDKGGWHITSTFTAGTGLLNPVNNNFLRGTGGKALFGWPTSPKLEALRDAWFQASDLAAQQAICRDIQMTAFEEVPYIPTGWYRNRTAHLATLVDLPKGLPLFYGLRRA